MAFCSFLRLLIWSHEQLQNPPEDLQYANQNKDLKKKLHRYNLHPDKIQWKSLPCCLVKPIQEVVEPILDHVSRGTIVKPKSRIRKQISTLFFFFVCRRLIDTYKNTSQLSYILEYNRYFKCLHKVLFGFRSQKHLCKQNSPWIKLMNDTFETDNGK